MLKMQVSWFKAGTRAFSSELISNKNCEENKGHAKQSPNFGFVSAAVFENRKTREASYNVAWLSLDTLPNFKKKRSEENRSNKANTKNMSMHVASNIRISQTWKSFKNREMQAALRKWVAIGAWRLAI